MSPLVRTVAAMCCLMATSCSQDLVLGFLEEEPDEGSVRPLLDMPSPPGDPVTMGPDLGPPAPDMSRVPPPEMSPPPPEEDMTPPPVPQGGFVQLSLWTEFSDRDDPGWSVGMMLSDVTGPVACQAIEDSDILPSGRGEQLWVFVAEELRAAATPGGSFCPVGEYVLARDSLCTSRFGVGTLKGSTKPLGCAEKRWWEPGMLIPMEEPMNSGLVRVSGSAQACDVTIEVVDETGARSRHQFVVALDTRRPINCSTAR